MRKSILIYADCCNSTARGDYAFAGSIAKDLSREFKLAGAAVDIFLVSSSGGVSRFKRLFDASNALPLDKVSIEGEAFNLCSLEQFDAARHNVSAFIVANPCQIATAPIIRHVLSPETKFLFILAANSSPTSSLAGQFCYLLHLENLVPGLLHGFQDSDVLIGTAGLGTEYLGLPAITASANAPPLNETQKMMLPLGVFGFMYLAATTPEKDYSLIRQYIKLTNFDEYILIGNFSTKSAQIEAAYNADTPSAKFPKMTFFPSVDNNVMRHMVGSSQDLIVSTGTMSTLEAMQSGKLPYYQVLENNLEFISSYLSALKSIVTTNSPASEDRSLLIIDLAQLLFAMKPLNNDDMLKTRELLSMDNVKRRLIDTNQQIIAQANGKLAPKLLTFLNSGRTTDDRGQLSFVCSSLRESHEQKNPSYEQALMRAVTNGKLFELKVILTSLPAFLKQKNGNLQRTALHWAVLSKQISSVRVLIGAGAMLDSQDSDQKTPLHYAIAAGDKDIIKELIAAGASLEVRDKNHETPAFGAALDVLFFIMNFSWRTPSDHQNVSNPLYSCQSSS